MYSRIASIILVCVALLHLSHAFFRLELSINGNPVPVWLSFLIGCGIMFVARKLEFQKK